jgi:hypothetical protein
MIACAACVRARAAARAVAQLPNTSVTTLADGQSPAAEILGASRGPARAVSGTQSLQRTACEERARGEGDFRSESGTELPESLIVCVILRRSSPRERSQFAGTSDKRLKGLEPSTFCMANGTASVIEQTFNLQSENISALTSPQRPEWDARKFRGFRAGFRNESGTNSSKLRSHVHALSSGARRRRVRRPLGSSRLVPWTS